jgi:hypothetical protein
MTRLVRALTVALFALLLLGCPEKKGPLEKAGEKMDNAVENAGDKIEDAAEEAGDAIEDAVDK